MKLVSMRCSQVEMVWIRSEIPEILGFPRNTLPLEFSSIVLVQVWKGFMNNKRAPTHSCRTSIQACPRQVMAKILSIKCQQLLAPQVCPAVTRINPITHLGKGHRKARTREGEAI